MNRQEREPQDIGQEGNSVPEEDIGFQYLLQAPSIKEAESPHAFTDKSPKHNDLIYVAAGKASTLERREDWKDIQSSNFDERRTLWKQGVVQFFTDNHNYFASPEGQTAAAFYKRLSDASEIKIDPLLPTLDMAESLFNQYFAKDDDGTSLSSKFVEDILKAEELLEEDSTQTNKVDRYREDRDIIWRTAHIFGKHSADIALHLLDSEISIKSGYDFTIFSKEDGKKRVAAVFDDEKQSSLLKRLAVCWPQGENNRTIVGAYQQKESTVQEKGANIDLAAKHWEILKPNYTPLGINTRDEAKEALFAGDPRIQDIPNAIRWETLLRDDFTTEERNELVEEMSRLLREGEKPKDFPTGDIKGQWIVDTLKKFAKNRGYEVTTQDIVEEKITRIKISEKKKGPTGTFPSVPVPPPSEHTLKGFPPSLPVDISTPENPTPSQTKTTGDKTVTRAKRTANEDVSAQLPPVFEPERDQTKTALEALATTNPVNSGVSENASAVNNGRADRLVNGKIPPDYIRFEAGGELAKADEIFERLQNPGYANLAITSASMDSDLLASIGLVLDEFRENRATSITKIGVSKKYRDNYLPNTRVVIVKLINKTPRTISLDTVRDFIRFGTDEDPSAKADEILDKLSIAKSGVVNVYAPVTALSASILGKTGLIQDVLAKKKGVSTTDLNFERVYIKERRGERAVIISFINKNPQKVSLP